MSEKKYIDIKVECKTCEGEGTYDSPYSSGPPYARKAVECDDCQGRGWQWDEKEVEEETHEAHLD